MNKINLTDFITKYKNKLLNIAIIILALLIANNIYKAQATIMASIRERKDAETKKNAVLEGINQLQKKLNSYKAIINNKELSSVINTFSNLARDSSVIIVSLRPLPQEAGPAYVEYPFTLTIEAADYHSIARFIAKLENSADIYIIGNVSISKGQEVDKQAKLKAELKLSTILVK